MAIRPGLTIEATIITIGGELQSIGRKIGNYREDLPALGATARTAMRNRIKAVLQTKVDELTALAVDIDAL